MKTKKFRIAIPVTTFHLVQGEMASLNMINCRVAYDETTTPVHVDGYSSHIHTDSIGAETDVGGPIATPGCWAPF